MFLKGAAFAFVALMIFVSMVTMFVVVHEAVHLVNFDRATGFCFGYCKAAESPYGWSTGLACGVLEEGSENGEFLPNVAGLLAMTAVGFVGVVSLGYVCFEKVPW